MGGCVIITERLSDGGSPAGERRTLKTIQRERGRTTVNSEMSFNLEGWVNQNTRLRIKHKSLILAQDERWRRA